MVGFAGFFNFMDEFTASTATESSPDSSTETATETAEYSTPEVETETDAVDEQPAAPAEPPYATFDAASLPEEASTAYNALKGDYDTLTGYKTEAEPVLSWVNERGGREAVEADVKLVDAAFSPDPEVRGSFFQTIYDQSPEAFNRIVGDITDNQYAQVAVLQKLGLDPEHIEAYRQVTTNGGALPETMQPSESVVDLAFLESLKPELRAVFKTLPQKVQEDYALRDPEVANWDLQQVAAAHAERQRQAAAQQQATTERESQRQQQIATAQKETYTRARNIVQESLAKAFPGDTVIPNIIASAVETELFDSPEGAAQWARLAEMIAKGETRNVKAELPLMIAKAQAMATEKSKHLAALYADARKWRESQQKENPRTEPGYGDQVGRGQVEKVNGAGGYRPENVFSYFNQAANR